MADNHLVNVCECFILQIPKFEIPLQFLTRRSQPSALSFSPGKIRVSFVSSMQSRHLQVTEKQLNGCVSSANARMAESVDALVSNTSGAIRAGSIPAPGTRKGLKKFESFFRVPTSQPQSLRDSPFQGHTAFRSRSSRASPLLQLSPKVSLTRMTRR